MDVGSLLEMYRVDLPHARRVAAHALALFDAVAERYSLPAGERRLLELGALLHNVGLTTDPPDHHLVGRDIVLRHEVDGLSRRERALVAALVAFHRKRARHRAEPAYLSLGKGRRRTALRLAAILRVADGLDYSQTQSTAVESVAEAPGGLALRLAGDRAGLDGLRAVAKADLWARVFGEALSAEGPGGEPLPPPAEEGGSDEDEAAILAPWYASPDAPLAELGRVLLRRNLRRMSNAERRVRTDEDAEAVHALRVATRRLRAILRLVVAVGPAAELRAHSRALGSLARAAGAVRDRDVLVADLASRAPELPEPLRLSAGVLLARLRTERRDAHERLLRFLDSDEHEAFVARLAATICRGKGWDDGPSVRDLGGSTLWRHYEALRAHARAGLPADVEALHEMRIEGKRLRYVLELFAEALGPQADAAADPLVAFQDHLGGLNDVAVAHGLLTPYTTDADCAPAVAAYLALREQQGEQFRAGLPARWEALAGDGYRRALMELIVGL